MPALLRSLAIVGLLSVTLAAMPSARAAGDTAPAPRTIAITATGTTTAKPDQVAITIGVSSDGKTAKAALNANSAAMKSVIDSVKASGVEDRDVQTEQFSVQPNYEFSQDGKPPKLTGYRVTNSAHVKLRSIEKLGDLLDRVVDKGSNQIGGISFIVGKQDELKDAARKDAVANATRMAKAYAAAAGVELGPVLAISEAYVGPQQPRFEMQMTRAKAAAEPVPIEAGEQTLDVQVSMVWQIK